VGDANCKLLEIDPAARKEKACEFARILVLAMSIGRTAHRMVSTGA